MNQNKFIFYRQPLSKLNSKLKIVIDYYRHPDEPDRTSIGYIKYACDVEIMFTIYKIEFIFYYILIMYFYKKHSSMRGTARAKSSGNYSIYEYYI